MEEAEDPASPVLRPLRRSPPSLETIALGAYLEFLETESVAYLDLCQSKSQFLSGLAPNLLYLLKSQLRGLSWVLRERMLERILSDAFPSAKHCRLVALKNKDDAMDSDSGSLPLSDFHLDHICSTCINTCCSGAFIQETMAGIVVNADVRSIIFNAEKMSPFPHGSLSCASGSLAGGAGPGGGPGGVLVTPYTGLLQFNAPVVLSHLFHDVQQRNGTCQLERLAFTESFVREEGDHDLIPIGNQDAIRKRKFMTTQLRVREANFVSQFSPLKEVGPVEPGHFSLAKGATGDRNGMALSMLIMFREILPPGGITGQYSRLTELILKNNVQCELYSKANFQFELLARIGFTCPRLRVLDIFGTDTWADCLVAFFFRDAFHSLHRYLFFMENEDDESSAYHPHDTTRYCQFCLDQLHASTIERPFTVNPVIPLLDEVYDHVLKKYPKRSFCILRNCVKVSDLISSTKSNVFELIRRDNLKEFISGAADGDQGEGDPLSLGDSGFSGSSSSATSSSSCAGACSTGKSIKHRLRSKKSSIDHGGRKHARKSSKRSVSSKISASFNEADLTPAKDSSSSHTPSRVSGRLRAKDSGQANLSKQALSTSSSEHQPTPPPIPERRGNEGDDEDEEEGEMNEDSAASEAATPSSSKSAKLSTMLSHSHDKESSLSRQICDRANKPEEGPKSSTKSKKVDDIDETTSPDLDHSPCDGGILTRSRKRKLSLDKPPPFSPEWKCSKRSGGSSLPLPGNCPESEKEQQQQHQPSRKVPGNRSDSSGNQKPASSTSSASSSSSTSEPNFFFDGGHKASITFKEWEEKTLKCYCKPEKRCNLARDKFDHGKPPRGVKGRIRCKSVHCWNYEAEWIEPEFVQYREVTEWPHLNECVQTLEVLNIGGTNVLGEFLPFILLHAPKLKSLGQWINTMIYGLEILRRLPGHEKDVFPAIQEFSYSSDRNYFCQPYIGFVPESNEFKNVRKEMVRFSGKVAKRIHNSSRNHDQKIRQISEDMNLLTDACPNIRKLNVVIHYKVNVLGDCQVSLWSKLLSLQNLVELDLVTMQFENVKVLLQSVGHVLKTLTLEMDEEQGNGSEIVHIGRYCPELTSLRLLLGDKVLKGEMTLHFASSFFRKLERLHIVGSVHLHAFAFLWGHCRNLKFMKLGLVVNNELANTNVLIYDAFTLIFQVNSMIHLEELHIKNLRIRTVNMGKYLLDNLPSLRRASYWILDMSEGVKVFKTYLKRFKARGLKLEYKEC